MFESEYARDLLLTAGILGLAAFAWSGWAQERPPSVAARVYLGVLSVAGAVLAGVGTYNGIKVYGDGSAMVVGEPSWIVYLAMCALEVAAALAAYAVLRGRGRTDLFAPVLLVIVGVHFAPLAGVFDLSVLYLLAAAVTVAGLAALRLPARRNAPSFWCGALAAPVFLAVAVPCLVIGLGRMAA
ncbi:hypothetical protein [Actinomadura flavalba]|uniref:hypothetical protein n=1 Tax=Actinomadura flavalba TaxID=1120938 RepID=UPI000366CB3E|nr:hypothetical protein [Actinomadura flavalba]